MIQGGDPMGTGFGGPGYQFEDETRVAAPLRQGREAGHGQCRPNTNGSQFFITVANTDWLTGKHTISARSLKATKWWKNLESRKNHQDRPKKDVVVKSVKIER